MSRCFLVPSDAAEPHRPDSGFIGAADADVNIGTSTSNSNNNSRIRIYCVVRDTIHSWVDCR